MRQRNATMCKMEAGPEERRQAELDALELDRFAETAFDDLTLLAAELGHPDENQPPKATVFASAQGLDKLRRKIEDFAEKNRTKKDGSEGRPYNADLVQSIGAIVEAGLRALWRSLDGHPIEVQLRQG